MPLNKIVFCACLLLTSLTFTLTGLSQDIDKSPVRVVFYNVDNLFDTNNDSLTDDEEFVQGGPRGWNFDKYWDKVYSLSKVIIAAGEWLPPDIIGLCEVENRGVVEDLIYKTNLSKYNYRLIHKDSPDSRGIDVCLIYRDDTIEVLDYDYSVPYLWKKENYRSREVLHAVLNISGDTLHLFVNHWPSRRGGVLATQGRRTEVSDFISYKVDSLTSVSGVDTNILIMGDFNSSPDDATITNLVNGAGEMTLVNLAESWPVGKGSYKYQGKWEYIDQIIISESLLYGHNGIKTSIDKSGVFNSGFLMVKDNNYTGERPLSTWWGYSYEGGYSDHLPVIVEIQSVIH